MEIYTTTPVSDLPSAGSLFAQLERDGYDGAFTYEPRRDPFPPLAVAAGRTERLKLGTAVAIAFARTPLVVASVARDLQDMSEGRFVLGLGTQIRPHIERRFSMPWSRPVARLREFVLALRAIWDAWEGVAPLEFRGEFYTHTLMPPAFSPGPSTHPRPPVLLGAVGPKLTAVGAEVADGLLVHPFATRESLLELTKPAIADGLARGGRRRNDLRVTLVVMIATGDSRPERDEALAAVRSQIAFYGSTPAYARILECNGRGDLHPRLHALSRQGRWDEMAALVPKEMVESIAVVGDRAEIPEKVLAKVDGIADAVSLECTRHPDPRRFADICQGIRERQ